MGGIGKALGKIGSFVGKVVQSPIFQIGLSALTGGMGGLLTKGISALASGGIGSIFSKVASSVLPQVGSMLSGSGNNILGSFLGAVTGQGGSSGGIADIFKSLVDGFASQPQQQLDQQSQQAAGQNIQQQAAYAMAQLLQNQFASQQA